MTVTDDKVTQFPTPLEQIGRRIDSAWHRTQKGEAEWIDGSLELAQALADGRKQFPADQAFGRWLKEHKHNHVNDHGRAALIGLASDLNLARVVLKETNRRSYELIWREVMDRFANARKPNKAKRGRRKGAAKRPPEHYAAAAKALDEGKTREEVAAETGLSDHQVQLAREREIGRREMLAELLDAAAAKNFTEKGKLRIEDAVRIHRHRLDKEYEQRRREDVRRDIEAANDAMRANNKKLHLENINLMRIVGQRGVFTKAQFRQMQMLCHPDSSASERTKAELSQILVENEVRLVKGDK